MTIYIDESGYTGEDLMNEEQPIFVLASTNVSDEEAEEIRNSVFARARSQELKHSSLVKRDSGRQMVLDFVSLISKTTDRFAVAPVHKEYCTLTKLVDLWLETAMYSFGYNLYEGGGNIAFCNMSYICLQGFESRTFLRKHLKRFQAMMRGRDRTSYRQFWGGIRRDRNRVDPKAAEILDFFLTAESVLGLDHLRNLPPRGLDISLTMALQIAAHWSRMTKEDLELVHDKSSPMSKAKWMWDLIVSPHVPKGLAGFDTRAIQYPLRVARTTFGDSKDHIQLQLSDILAGAAAAWARKAAGVPKDLDYSEALQDAGIMETVVFGIWPSENISRRSLPTGQAPQDPFRFLQDIVEKELKKQEGV